MYKNYSNPFELLDDEYSTFEKINKFKECKICCSEYSTSITMLKCGHELCEFCLIDIIKLPHNGGYVNLEPRCPFCRIIIKNHSGIKNSTITNILSILENKKTKSKFIEPTHNQKYCLCSECNNVFIVFSNCGDNLDKLPKICIKCHDRLPYTYGVKESYDIKMCGWCKLQYIKIDGCNYVKCVCGNYTCYLCGQRRHSNDVHFCNSSKNSKYYAFSIRTIKFFMKAILKIFLVIVIIYLIHLLL
jgi:hypothetical protein